MVAGVCTGDVLSAVRCSQVWSSVYTTCDVLFCRYDFFRSRGDVECPRGVAQYQKEETGQTGKFLDVKSTLQLLSQIYQNPY